MSKGSYRFNHETLSFEKIEKSILRTIYKVIIPQFILSAVLGIFMFIGTSYITKSPMEQSLLERNSKLKLKYELLNKSFDKSAKFLDKLEKRDDYVYRMVFQADPIPNSVRRAGFGGSERYSFLKGYSFSDLMIKTSLKLDILSKQMAVQSKSYDEIVELVKDKEKMLACIPSIQPISNKDLTRFGSPFGLRFHPILHVIRMHTGIDLTCPKGTKIYAPGDGVVMRVDHERGGYGNSIRINHGFGIITLYGHLSKTLVRPGQTIKRGDVIGLVGSTGLSTCPHLHYEVRINNTPVNPVNYYYNDLTDDEYKKMTDMASDQETHVFEK
jgi:murein DD-endopeptidase MepM/ murein hydrolase activator NlpD